MSKFKILGGLLLLGFLSSCVTNKNYVLLQEQKALEAGSITRIKTQPNANYLIQPNDILKVDIKTLDDKTATFFNGLSAAPLQGGLMAGSDPYYMFGYHVNDSGFLILPVVGEIKVTGLSLSQAKISIEEKLEKYFKGAYVSVQLGGIRFSILGEVRAPGKYVVLQNRLTILEALATAGDLTPVANRKKIKILRQLPGEMQVEIIDLTKANLIESPSLYIRPNDVIYVEPLKIRAIGTGVTGTETLTAFATVLSVVSSVLLINNLLR